MTPHSRPRRIVLVAPFYPEHRNFSDHYGDPADLNVPPGLYYLKAAIDNSPLSEHFEVIVGEKAPAQTLGDHALLRWIVPHEPDVVGLGSS